MKKRYFIAVISGIFFIRFLLPILTDTSRLYFINNGLFLSDLGYDVIYASLFIFLSVIVPYVILGWMKNVNYYIIESSNIYLALVPLAFLLIYIFHNVSFMELVDGDFRKTDKKVGSGPFLYLFLVTMILIPTHSHGTYRIFFLNTVKALTIVLTFFLGGRLNFLVYTLIILRNYIVNVKNLLIILLSIISASLILVPLRAESVVIDFDVLSNQFLTYYQQFSLADQFVLFYEVQNLEVTQPLIYNIIWPVSEYINYPADKINNLLSQLVDQTNESGLHPTIVLQLVAGTSVLNASLLGLSIGVYMSGLRTIASYLNSFFLLMVIDVWFIYMIFESTFRLHMFNAVFFGAIAIILISRTLKNPIKNIFNRLCLSSKKMRFI